MELDVVIDAGVKKVTAIWKDGAIAIIIMGMNELSRAGENGERGCRELASPAMKWQKWKDERG